jgi:hypothetical protein
MDYFARSIFWISTAGFLASCLVAFFFWVNMFSVRAEPRDFRLRDVTLWGKPCSSKPAARYARDFMRCLLVAAGFWCTAFITGLSAGILH